MRRWAAVAISALAVGGCESWQQRFRKPAPQPAGPAPAATRPATSPAGGEAPPAAVMATVNGRPIYMDELTAPLLEAHGVRMAEMLIANRLVSQEAARKGVTVTEQDVARENALMLRGIFGEELSPDQRDRMLTELLRRRGLTRGLWRRTMWRNATLRKMAEPRVKIGEPMLKAEFARQYGKKVQVSHIQLPTLTDAEKILNLLKGGKDFAELAKRYSTNTTTAAKGGLLPVFSRDDTRVPQAMRDAAFELKPGQTSSIVQAGNEFQVLKLHKRIIPPDVDYESVKEKLREDLRDSLIERVQREILARLRGSAAVEYVNPILSKALKEQFQAPPEP